jgi:lysophospholipase L1-like esterase
MKYATCLLVLLIIGLPGCKKSTNRPEIDITIVGWGDSLTKGIGGQGTTYLSVLADLTGAKTINRGTAGSTSTQIKGNMLKDTALYKYPTIIWAGRNNYWQGETVKKDIAAMIAKLNHTNYLVLGIINAESTGEYKGTPNYQAITALNDQLAQIYGDHYIDIRAFLVSQYNANYAADVKDHEKDVVPISLRADSLHLNFKGYQLVAKKIYSDINRLTAK